MPCSERPSVRDVARRQITNTFLKTKYPFKNANKNVLDINIFEPGVFFLLMTIRQSSGKSILELLTFPLHWKFFDCILRPDGVYTHLFSII
jgi:hypothetical protein